MTRQKLSDLVTDPAQKQGLTSSAKTLLKAANDNLEKEASKSWIARAELELVLKEATELIETTPEPSKE